MSIKKVEVGPVERPESCFTVFQNVLGSLLEEASRARARVQLVFASSRLQSVSVHMVIILLHSLSVWADVFHYVDCVTDPTSIGFTVEDKIYIICL